MANNGVKSEVSNVLEAVLVMSGVFLIAFVFAPVGMGVGCFLRRFCTTEQVGPSMARCWPYPWV